MKRQLICNSGGGYLGEDNDPSQITNEEFESMVLNTATRKNAESFDEPDGVDEPGGRVIDEGPEVVTDDEFDSMVLNHLNSARNSKVDEGE